MKPFVQHYSPKKANYTHTRYDRMLRGTVEDETKVDVTIVGKKNNYKPKQLTYQNVKQDSVDITIMRNERTYLWGVFTSMVDNFEHSWNRETNQHDVNRSNIVSTRMHVVATSEIVHHYRNRHCLSGLNYEATDRRLWNPLRDDSLARLVEFEENEELQKWLTNTYIEMRPDLKEYFERSRPHTPPMAAMAFRHPGFRVLVFGGWVPTIPFSPNRGIFKVILDQPNPKRMLNYVYGSHSKDNFKHMKTFMDLPNNWFMLMLARIGRETLPSEWLKEIELTTEETYPRLDMVLSGYPFSFYKSAFSDVKPKKLLDLFKDAARSTDNIELFFDTMRMGTSLKREVAEANRIDVWADVDTRHIDELHTRTTELYNEHFARRARWYGGTRNWKPEDKLKPAKELLEIQDSTIGDHMSLRVAEQACEVADWGMQQEHCIASYIPNAKRGATTLLGIYRNKTIYANVAVSGGRITQLRGKGNRRIEPEDESLIKTVVAGAFASQGS